MTSINRNSIQKNVIFFWILPASFILPEVINLGFIFLRWDYLLIALLYFLLHKKNNEVVFSGAKNLLTLYFIFFAYQLLATQGAGEDFISSVKYASWPIKIILWSLVVANLMKIYKFDYIDVNIFLSVLVIIVFCMQCLEITSSPFRLFLFEYYPVAAQERLLDLGYRARGPFSGYDLASIFYVFCAIIINEISVKFNAKKYYFVVLLCVIGAILSARTGFILLTFYLLISLFLRGSVSQKIYLSAFIVMAVILSSQINGFGKYDDGDLVGRYMELLGALVSGDSEMISSVNGTFYMNESLDLTGINFWFGSGLISDTTADQLYFKYFYMYGAVGLLLWCYFHFAMIIYCANLCKYSENSSTYGLGILVFLVLLVFAHIKGGNYIFSARFGEIFALIFMLAEKNSKLRYE